MSVCLIGNMDCFNIGRAAANAAAFFCPADLDYQSKGVAAKKNKQSKFAFILHTAEFHVIIAVPRFFRVLGAKARLGCPGAAVICVAFGDLFGYCMVGHVPNAVVLRKAGFHR